MAEAPKSKITKEEAEYRPLEQCLLCVKYRPPNSCDKVEGNISPNAVCDEFNIQESSKPWNKEFYQKELEKQQKREKRKEAKSVEVLI